MRSSIIASALLASLVLSKPIEKRSITTEEVVVTVTTTVTAEPTPSAAIAADFLRSSAVASASVESSSSSVAVSLPISTSSAAPATTLTTSTESVPTTTSASTAAQSSSVTSSASSASSSVSATTVSAASATGSSGYQNTILNQHNYHRANHSAADLTWSDSLAATALKIAQSCVYAHDVSMDGGGYGQNIGAGAPASEVGAMITNEMYNGEIGYYPLPYGQDSPDMTNFERWGHFSQIVWSETTEVGCATFQCSTLENTGADVAPYFTVCNYSPPGNYAGEYNNVGTPLGDATITA